MLNRRHPSSLTEDSARRADGCESGLDALLLLERAERFLADLVLQVMIAERHVLERGHAILLREDFGGGALPDRRRRVDVVGRRVVIDDQLGWVQIDAGLLDVRAVQRIQAGWAGQVEIVERLREVVGTWRGARAVRVDEFKAAGDFTQAALAVLVL